MTRVSLIACSLAVATICLGAGPADAEDWNLKPADQPFAPSELAALPGQAFVFFDDGEARFGKDGAYSYTNSAANGGATSWGSYRIAQDGSVCIDYVDGFSRCDLYVHSHGRVVLINQAGDRFPVR
ncbi:MULTISPECIES: hypothetical protein [Rhodobacterales]|jgi:hypothetical protein|uniref:hypothetical protein n=1 Tax=Rhodobacterales TaxID=204455 RepID=UPI00237F65ED|nr:hypothetical protein [Phaeobacter gallaeciensis]MDE4098408.1 hypothetical protein [Phaeobacter gallaeciensis]MDE4107218.1 hypothetical protein [Phaeobacter gallaeciensis]MDE4111830.1 hypothetical protein [Phaeobacter gallaeciensis]MDE4116143.1 hypothetical protein [Phaeobacter gallaeciensis]MDE4120614.1 hypothetical protein [Phaeobacter gallaeciensis]